jgi:hypothetical protein
MPRTINAGDEGLAYGMIGAHEFINGHRVKAVMDYTNVYDSTCVNIEPADAEDDGFKQVFAMRYGKTGVHATFYAKRVRWDKDGEQ